MNYEEDLLDLVDPDDFGQKAVLPMKPDPDRELIVRLKERTFARLGLAIPVAPQPSARKITRQTWTLAASVLLVLLISAFLSSPQVRAELLKKLRFLPGAGTVQTSDISQTTYVLEIPVKASAENGTITVRSVQIDDKLATVSLTGSAGTKHVESIRVTNEEGQTYLLKKALMQWSSEWGGSYYFRGPIHVTKNMNLHLNDVDLDITVQLSPAREVNDLEQLGPTVFRNGIKMTAVTSVMNAEDTRVTLLTELPETTKIESFGIGSFTIGPKSLLTDRNGTPVPYRQDSEFPNPNELIYKPGRNPALPYRLHVAAVTAMKQTGGFQFDLPIPPKEGETIPVNETIEVLGHPIDIVKVTREGPNIVIFFNTRYDPNNAESLLTFWPYVDIAGDGYASTMKFNEATGAMERLWVDIPDGASTYTFKVKEATVIIRGPWEFSLQ